ncbi:MAG: glycosyltransferase family 4 protein [Pseudomonadota bacterium]
MDQNKPKMLFIAERFPPSLGGQQNYNFHLYREFKAHLPAFLIAPGIYLPFNLHKLWYFPYAVAAGIRIGRKHRITHVHISSARLAPVGLLIAGFLKVTLSASVHGLDVTLSGKSFFYKWLTPRCLARFNHIFCNSPATLARCIQIGLRPGLCHMVPCGVDGAVHRRTLTRKAARMKLHRMLGIDFEKKVILLTVGRLVKRKGVAWFAETLMPRLPEDHVYIVLGASGPELRPVRRLIETPPLAQRVFIFPDAPDTLRSLVYDAADLFVMPNIRVAGQQEGFGLVLLEAGMHNIPVVASAIEGIPAAVRDGITGLLVKTETPEAFIRAIGAVQKWDTGEDKIRRAVSAVYGWDKAYRAIASILGFPPPDHGEKGGTNE